MFVPVKMAVVSSSTPAPFMTMENIQAIAVGFVQMAPGAVSAEELNADDIDV